MITPHPTEDSHTGTAMPVMSPNMEEKDAPHTAAWMPNQPMQEMARIVLMMYLAPFSPSAQDAATEVGRPVSHPSIPMKIINMQISA